MIEFTEWAVRHGISTEALNELREIIGTSDTGVQITATGEAAVQNAIRLATSQNGWLLWRNNVGVLQDDRGVPVRYGLANDSKALNEKVKSSDLIGIRPVLITPDMVGKTIGQFAAVEVKRSEWKYTGTKREAAQLKFINLVIAAGGFAKFANSPGDL
jgi:hypothetical protein